MFTVPACRPQRLLAQRVAVRTRGGRRRRSAGSSASRSHVEFRRARRRRSAVARPPARRAAAAGRHPGQRRAAACRRPASGLGVRRRSTRMRSTPARPWSCTAAGPGWSPGRSVGRRRWRGGRCRAAGLSCQTSPAPTGTCAPRFDRGRRRARRARRRLVEPRRRRRADEPARAGRSSTPACRCRRRERQRDGDQRALRCQHIVDWPRRRPGGAVSAAEIDAATRPHCFRSSVAARAAIVAACSSLDGR